jgi:hypothetical protein
MKDVCATIDLEQEQELLLEDDMDELSPPPSVSPEMPVHILNLGPLRNKVQRKGNINFKVLNMNSKGKGN